MLLPVFLLFIGLSQAADDSTVETYFGVPLGSLDYKRWNTTAEVYAADEHTLVFSRFSHKPSKKGCVAVMLGPSRRRDNERTVGNGVLLRYSQPNFAWEDLRKRMKRDLFHQFMQNWPSPYAHLEMKEVRSIAEDTESPNDGVVIEIETTVSPKTEVTSTTEQLNTAPLVLLKKKTKSIHGSVHNGVVSIDKPIKKNEEPIELPDRNHDGIVNTTEISVENVREAEEKIVTEPLTLKKIIQRLSNLPIARSSGKEIPLKPEELIEKDSTTVEENETTTMVSEPVIMSRKPIFRGPGLMVVDPETLKKFRDERVQNKQIPIELLTSSDSQDGIVGDTIVGDQHQQLLVRSEVNVEETANTLETTTADTAFDIDSRVVEKDSADLLEATTLSEEQLDRLSGLSEKQKKLEEKRKNAAKSRHFISGSVDHGRITIDANVLEPAEDPFVIGSVENGKVSIERPKTEESNDKDDKPFIVGSVERGQVFVESPHKLGSIDEKPSEKKYVRGTVVNGKVLLDLENEESNDSRPITNSFVKGTVTRGKVTIEDPSTLSASRPPKRFLKGTVKDGKVEIDAENETQKEIKRPNPKFVRGTVDKGKVLLEDLNELDSTRSEKKFVKGTVKHGAVSLDSETSESQLENKFIKGTVRNGNVSVDNEVTKENVKGTVKNGEISVDSGNGNDLTDKKNSKPKILVGETTTSIGEETHTTRIGSGNRRNWTDEEIEEFMEHRSSLEKKITGDVEEAESSDGKSENNDIDHEATRVKNEDSKSSEQTSILLGTTVTPNDENETKEEATEARFNDNRFSLPHIDDESAAFLLNNGASLTDYRWIALYDQCTKETIPLISLDGLDPPKEETIGPIVGNDRNASSGPVKILNCNTILIPEFFFEETAKNPTTYFYVGVGTPAHVDVQKRARVVGFESGDPIDDHRGDDVMIRLPKGLRTFDVDFLAIYNEATEEYYGFVTFPSVLVPPCSER